MVALFEEMYGNLFRREISLDTLKEKYEDYVQLKEFSLRVLIHSSCYHFTGTYQN